MINRKRLAVGLCSVGLAVSACNNDGLLTVNENPNNPTDAPTTTLFTSAVQNGVARWMDGINSTRFGFLPQHMAEVQYPESDDYRRIRAAGTSLLLFDRSYSIELQDLELVSQRGAAAGQPGTAAPAKILQMWELGIITDSWGDVPFSQAFQADSILNPKYDAQRDIYTNMLAALSTSSASLTSAANTLGDADPIYAGAPLKWQKFANSLKARHALRLVNVDPALANSQLTAALAAPGGVILTNADNATLVWPGDGVYDNPWATNFKSRDDNRISDDLVTVLRAGNDPRVYVLAQRADKDTVEIAGQTVKWCPDGVTPCFVGLVNAQAHASASPLVPVTSRIGASWYPGATSYGNYGGSGSKYPSYLMTAAEMQFVRAEAAERGLAGLAPGQARGFYEAGIRANMEMLEVPPAAIATFIANPANVYAGGVAGLQQIATQKWLALMIDPLNAWAELRRTCSPTTIKPGPNAIEATIPRRFYYSSNETATNNTNVQEAIARQGADNFKSRVYWDTKPTAAPTYVAGCNAR